MTKFNRLSDLQEKKYFNHYLTINEYNVTTIFLIKSKKPLKIYIYQYLISLIVKVELN